MGEKDNSLNITPVINILGFGVEVTKEIARTSLHDLGRLGEKALALAREKLIEEEKFLTPVSDKPVPPSAEVTGRALREVVDVDEVSPPKDSDEVIFALGLTPERLTMAKKARELAEANIVEAHHPKDEANHPALV